MLTQEDAVNNAVLLRRFGIAAILWGSGLAMALAISGLLFLCASMLLGGAEPFRNAAEYAGGALPFVVHVPLLVSVGVVITSVAIGRRGMVCQGRLAVGLMALVPAAWLLAGICFSIGLTVMARDLGSLQIEIVNERVGDRLLWQRLLRGAAVCCGALALLTPIIWTLVNRVLLPKARRFLAITCCWCGCPAGTKETQVCQECGHSLAVGCMRGLRSGTSFGSHPSRGRRKAQRFRPNRP